MEAVNAGKSMKLQDGLSSCIINSALYMEAEVRVLVTSADVGQ
jgi:hypothetical protein